MNSSSPDDVILRPNTIYLVCTLLTRRLKNVLDQDRTTLDRCCPVGDNSLDDRISLAGPDQLLIYNRNNLWGLNDQSGDSAPDDALSTKKSEVDTV